MFRVKKWWFIFLCGLIVIVLIFWFGMSSMSWRCLKVIECMSKILNDGKGIMMRVMWW